MKNSLVFWVEAYFYNPNIFQKLLSLFLLPLSYLYCFVMWIRFKRQVPEDFGVDILSVGNLTVGGSGKTPLVTALAKAEANPAIILRGYGRQSSGCIVVKNREEILVDVSVSGDEAMIYARHLPHAVVIVSEDRKVAIRRAKELGCERIFLDDAYSKHDILKKDILIDVDVTNKYCLPSGAFRERVWAAKDVTFVKEDIDFKRHVCIRDARNKMLLVTAIARPERLDPYLPDGIQKHYFADHHNFSKEELVALLAKSGADSLLVTFKDYVKIEHFNLPLSLLDLEIKLIEEGSFTKK